MYDYSNTASATYTEIPSIQDGILPLASSISLSKELLDLFERANHIASMTSLDELLDQMLDLMIEVSGGDAGTLYLLDHTAAELVFRVVKGDESCLHLVGKRIREDQGIVGAAVQLGRPVVVDDLSSDPRWFRKLNAEGVDRLQNAITIPLLAQGVTIGAVQIFNYQVAQVELLQLLGNRMASEVSKVLLLEKANRSNRRLEELVEIMGDIAANLDHESLLQSVTEYAMKLLDAGQSSVYMVDPNSRDQMRFVSTRASEQVAPNKTPQALADAFAGSVPLASSIREQDPGFVANSAVAVPLRSHLLSLTDRQDEGDEKTAGLLMALNKQKGAFDAEDKRLLEILANQTSTVLQVANLYNEANELFLDAVKALVAAIDAKDPYTQGHSLRVSEFSVVIAEELGIAAETVRKIRVGSLLHDVGKIGVPDRVLRKPGRLTDEEFQQTKQHAAIGKNIISQVSMLADVIPAIAEHHERLDGSGYPLGLREQQISIMGRIVAVADVFDAMASERPYRPALPVETVLEYLTENTGVLFDHGCVQALISAIDKGKIDPDQVFAGVTGLVNPSHL